MYLNDSYTSLQRGGDKSSCVHCVWLLMQLNLLVFNDLNEMALLEIITVVVRSIFFPPDGLGG